MKKNYKVFLLVLVIALLASPARTIGQEMLKEKLQGVWVEIKDEYWNNDTLYEDAFAKSLGYDDSYRFFDNKIEFMNSPFFSWFIYEDNRGSLEDFGYKGNEDFISDYNVTNQCLWVRRIKLNDWVKFQIIKLENDTLILDRNEYRKTFAKRKYNYNKDVKINQITFWNEIGEIAIPVYKIEINNDRTVYLTGIENTKYLGKYKSKLSKRQYKKLINSLLMVDLRNLKASYSIDMTDALTYYLKIVYNDSKIIYVKDYGQGGPVELKWFYPKITALIDILNFKKIK
jgi:hypothetical protein